MARGGLVARVTLPVEAVPKARPRLGRAGAYTPARTVAAERALAWHLLDQLPARYAPATDLLAVRIVIARKRRSRCDIDNIIKLILDASNRILWRDDSQIRDIHATLIHTNASPYVHIEVYRWTEVPL